MKVIYLKKHPKNSRFCSVVFLQTHIKNHKNESIHIFSQHFFTWGWDKKFMVLICNLKNLLHAVAIQAGQKFQSNLWIKQIFLVFNDCQDMLQKNVDEIMSQPFPAKGDFRHKHWSWFDFATIFFNQIARHKVNLKLVFNSIKGIQGNHDLNNLSRHLFKLYNTFFFSMYKGLQQRLWICGHWSVWWCQAISLCCLRLRAGVTLLSGQWATSEILKMADIGEKSSLHEQPLHTRSCKSKPLSNRQ